MSAVWSWYVFNVADAAIVCGVAALVTGEPAAQTLAQYPGRYEAGLALTRGLRYADPAIKEGR